MPKFFLQTLTLVAVLATACHEGHVNGKRVKEEMQERRLYHITPQELIMGADAAGARMVAALAQLQKSAALADSTQPCTKALAPMLDSLRKNGVDEASRLVWDNWAPQPDQPKVHEVLDAIKFSHAEGQAIPPNLQKDGVGGFHYVAALTLPARGCKGCHADKAWQAGDTIGVWNLRFSEKPAALEASRGKKGM